MRSAKVRSGDVPVQFLEWKLWGPSGILKANLGDWLFYMVFICFCLSWCFMMLNPFKSWIYRDDDPNWLSLIPGGLNDHNQLTNGYMGPDPRYLSPGSVRSRLSSVKLSKSQSFEEILWILCITLSWLLVVTVGWCSRWTFNDLWPWITNESMVCWALNGSTQSVITVSPMAAWLHSDLTADRRMMLHHQI